MAKSANNVSTKELTGAQVDKPNQVMSMLTAMGVPMMGGTMQPGKPTFKTYREMRQNPTVALARMVATAPIRTAEWTLEADDGVPEEQVEFLSQNLTQIWHDLVNDSLLALDYGYAPGELIYEESEGQVCLARVKPLLVDKTTILCDDHGAEKPSGKDSGRTRIVRSVSLFVRLRGWEPLRPFAAREHSIHCMVRVGRLAEKAREVFPQGRRRRPAGPLPRRGRQGRGRRHRPELPIGEVARREPTKRERRAHADDLEALGRRTRAGRKSWGGYGGLVD